MTILNVYRGLHCPRCKAQMADFMAHLDQLADFGANLVSVSMDPAERAEKAVTDWGLADTRVGYGLSEAQARSLGLYISQSIKDTETSLIEQFLYPKYGRDIEEYNLAHDTTYGGYEEILLSPRAPSAQAGQSREDWLTYVRSGLNGHFIRLAPRCADRYRRFLGRQYQDDIKRLNWTYETSHESFDTIARRAEKEYS